MHLTLQKPKARSIFLSNLIKSTMPRNNVLRASEATSLPMQAPLAIGTGLA